MTAKVILKKKFKTDNFGYLSIQYFNGKGKKKVLSLGVKVNDNDFDKYLDSEFNLFKKTTKIDYKFLNSKITEKISDFTIYEDKPKNAILSFIEYFRKQITLIPNPSTRNGYNSTLNKLEEFKTFKKYPDILFTDIDYTFVIELRNFFYDNISTNTTRQYIITIKSILNLAKREGLYIEKFNYFSKLNISTTYSNKKILSSKDVNTLFEIKRGDEYFYFRNMLLFSMFCSGLRVSDLLLIRNSDFKKDYIEVVIKKTSKVMRIPYNEKLITLLFEIYDLWDFDLTQIHPYNRSVNRYFNTIENRKKKHELFNNKDRLLKHIVSLPKDDFLFHSFVKNQIPLLKYSKLKELTKEQYVSLNKLRCLYNQNLVRLRKHYKLDIEKISSHAGRYSWTNILLDIEGVNLLDISRSLGHKNLSITESYIERNFGLNKLENLGSKMSDKFIV